jgi:hypothetical protein
MTSLELLTAAAEAKWLAGWTAGPAEAERSGLPTRAAAPDLLLDDQTGVQRRLSEFWTIQPALLMFWRHFGCGCGAARAARLKAHPHELGVSFQSARREQGRPLVDDPWRAVAEYVIGSDGLVRLCYAYQHCEDFPDPRVLTTAARLS